MRQKRLLVLCICLLNVIGIAQKSYAQEPIPRHPLIDTCDQAFLDVSINAIDICRSCYEQIRAEGNSGQIAEGAMYLADAFYKFQHLDSAVFYYQLSANIFKDQNRVWEEADAHMAIANAYTKKASYYAAISEYIVAIELIENSSAYEDSVIPYYANVASLLQEINELDRAEYYYLKGLEQFDKYESDVYHVLYLLAYAELNLEVGKIAKADSLIKRAEAIDVDKLYATYSNAQLQKTKGEYLLKNGEYKLALAEFDKLIPLFDRMRNFVFQTEVLLGRSACLLKLDQKDASVAILQSLICDSLICNHLYLQVEVYEDYSFALDEIGAYEQASVAKSILLNLHDSIFENQRRRDLSNVLISELKEDNSQLNRTNTKNIAVVESYQAYSNLLTVISVLGGVFVVILLGLLWRLWKLTVELRKRRAQVHSQNIRLLEVDKRRVELVKIIGHDLRSPIWAIRNFLAILTEEKSKEPHVNSMKEYALKSVIQVQDILEELTQWAESSDELVHLYKKSINLKRVVDKTISGVILLAESRKVSVVNHIPENCILNSDTRLISIIFRNLIENSVKYTSNGFVMIGYEEEKEEFYIEDSGRGMSESQIEFILSAVWKANEGVNREKGLGLGLVAVARACHQLGAFFEIKSEEGVGTRVSIYNLRIED